MADIPMVLHFSPCVSISLVLSLSAMCKYPHGPSLASIPVVLAYDMGFLGRVHLVCYLTWLSVPLLKSSCFIPPYPHPSNYYILVKDNKPVTYSDMSVNMRSFNFSGSLWTIASPSSHFVMKNSGGRQESYPPQFIFLSPRLQMLWSEKKKPYSIIQILSSVNPLVYSIKFALYLIKLLTAHQTRNWNDPRIQTQGEDAVLRWC